MRLNEVALYVLEKFGPPQFLALLKLQQRLHYRVSRVKY